MLAIAVNMRAIKIQKCRVNYHYLAKYFVEKYFWNLLNLTYLSLYV